MKKIKDKIKQFLCFIGHHNVEYTGFDGASAHAKCKWCGYEGMIDSTGSLF
jgi:hypothetical protein